MSILSKIQDCTNCHSLREIFHKEYSVFVNPEIVQNFKSRLEFLKTKCVLSRDVLDFDILMDDVELEVEFGAMRKAEAVKLQQGKVHALKLEIARLAHRSKAMVAMENKLQNELDQKSEVVGPKEAFVAQYLSNFNLDNMRNAWHKVERELIIKAVMECRTKALACKVLGISSRRLRNKLAEYRKQIELLEFVCDPQIPKILNLDSID